MERFLADVKFVSDDDDDLNDDGLDAEIERIASRLGARQRALHPTR